MVEPTPWPTTPPAGVPRAVDLVAEVLHDAFKGATDVDLDMLAADVVDAVTGRALTVELRWYDGDGGVDDEGTFVLGRIESSAGALSGLGAPADGAPVPGNTGAPWVARENGKADG